MFKIFHKSGQNKHEDLCFPKDVKQGFDSIVYSKLATSGIWKKSPDSLYNDWQGFIHAQMGFCWQISEPSTVWESSWLCHWGIPSATGVEEDRKRGFSDLLSESEFFVEWHIINLWYINLTCFRVSNYVIWCYVMCYVLPPGISIILWSCSLSKAIIGQSKIVKHCCSCSFMLRALQRLFICLICVCWMDWMVCMIHTYITNKLFCFGCFKRPIYDAREIENLQCHIHIVKIGMVQNLGTKRAQIGHIVVFRKCTH